MAVRRFEVVHLFERHLLRPQHNLSLSHVHTTFAFNIRALKSLRSHTQSNVTLFEMLRCKSSSHRAFHFQSAGIAESDIHVFMPHCEISVSNSIHLLYLPREVVRLLLTLGTCSCDNNQIQTDLLSHCKVPAEIGDRTTNNTYVSQPVVSTETC